MPHDQAGHVSDYDEGLAAPPLWWLGGLAVAVLLAAGIHAGGSGARAVVPYVLLPLIVLGGLALGSRGRVRVADGVLHVPGARIALTHIGGTTPLRRAGVRQVRGPLAEPRAFVTSRPWLPDAVRVQIEDPDDDTPYWLVGTRDPEALAHAISQGRT